VYGLGRRKGRLRSRAINLGTQYGSAFRPSDSTVNMSFRCRTQFDSDSLLMGGSTIRMTKPNGHPTGARSCAGFCDRRDSTYIKISGAYILNRHKIQSAAFIEFNGKAAMFSWVAGSPKLGPHDF